MAQAPPTPTSYPHVDGVTDWRAAQSLKLLWDQIVDLRTRVSAAEATITTLGTTTSAQAQQITTIGNKADEALSLAQLPGGTALGPAGGSGGSGSDMGPASGPGSVGEPIIPMSSDATTAEDQVKRSLAYWNRTDYGYWSGLIHIPSMAPWQGGDSKWYVGFDAYFEARMSPSDPGSADHSLLPLPAVHQDPVPPGYPSGGWT